MFFRSKNSLDASEIAHKMTAFFALLAEYPIDRDNFLESLRHFLTILGADTGSIYALEEKTRLFLLKKWAGLEPRHLSISEDYEFVQYLKNRRDVVLKTDFSQKSANELRQPALLYFQHTNATLAYLVCHEGRCLAILNIGFAKDEVPDKAFCGAMIRLYAEHVKNQLVFQGVLQERDKLSEISHVKNQLLANVTHELQTPLNGILGLAEALLDDPELSESQRSAIRLMQQSGQKLAGTVDSILKLAQIEAKKSETRFKRSNLVPLVQEILLLYGEAVQERGNRLIAALPQEELNAYIDADQIRTVLMNLLSNALKFTENGEIRVELQKSGTVVRFSVSDTGIGIDEDKTSLIFEEFYQADGSHTRLFGGTGLGLAIAKKIIDLHGGRIWVESIKGKGSKFIFTLPVNPV